ncbi:MAG: hypothetical protein H6624_02495 [Bdellovibrionaceae bacterium]|nr:hypothetical protein [Bdellovibrionales bacterium]MCB9083180.1 hypothetical protein [Pseudobdellovibrionaceae bacterium]
MISTNTLETLYQDKDLCIINKPSGYVVHRTKGASQFPAVLQTLRDQLGQRIYPVHRLDRGTSGCLAFALSSESAKKLQFELQSDTAIKKYTALCLGHLEPEGQFDRELFNENKVKQKALTRYRVLQSFSQYSLLELQIFTRRKNQIRRHLSYEGHHLIGDVQYGKGWLNRRFRDQYDFHRLFLHCHYISFIHPYTGERLQLSCDLPKRLRDLLSQLDCA